MRLATRVFIRNFVLMDHYLRTITDFSAEISKSIPITAEALVANVCRLCTEKCCIYIYLPHASRLPNHHTLATIHIDVDQLLHGSAKIIRRLRGIHGLGLRIYGRQTVAARIDKRTAMDFQDEHHINDAFPGKYRFGLYRHGELVSIAVFSGGRLMRAEGEGYRSFELIRFCHKGDVLVVGGLSKLLNAFIKAFNPQDIMTYADLDWTQESSLATIGFVGVSCLMPQTFYVVNGVRQSRIGVSEKADYSITNKGSLKLKLIL